MIQNTIDTLEVIEKGHAKRIIAVIELCIKTQINLKDLNMISCKTMEVARALTPAEWEFVSGGNGASDSVIEEQIETVVVSGGYFAGGGLGLLVGSSISHGGGNTFYGPLVGIGGGGTIGYATSGANASRSADNINEGLEICLPVCIDFNVQGLFSNDFKISVGARAGVFYGSTELL